jgi:hypothetical protein
MRGMQEGCSRMYRHLDRDLESQPGKLPIWDREIFHTVATRAGPSLSQPMDFAEILFFHLGFDSNRPLHSSLSRVGLSPGPSTQVALSSQGLDAGQLQPVTQPEFKALKLPLAA